MIEYLPKTFDQISGILYSIGIGFALIFIFEILKLFFFILFGNEKKANFICDLFFVLICLIVSFFFLLVKYNGKVVFYAVFGEIIGGIIAFKSLDNLFSRLFKSFLLKLKGKTMCLIGFFRMKFLNLKSKNKKN